MSKIVARREAVYGLYRYGDFVAIARKTGLSAPTVSRALRGEPCTISTARKICDLFGALHTPECRGSGGLLPRARKQRRRFALCRLLQLKGLDGREVEDEGLESRCEELGAKQ